MSREVFVGIKIYICLCFIGLIFRHVPCRSLLLYVTLHTFAKICFRVPLSLGLNLFTVFFFFFTALPPLHSMFSHRATLRCARWCSRTRSSRREPRQNSTRRQASPQATSEPRCSACSTRRRCPSSPPPRCLLPE